MTSWMAARPLPNSMLRVTSRLLPMAQMHARPADQRLADDVAEERMAPIRCIAGLLQRIAMAAERGQLREDVVFYTGKSGAQFAAQVPFPVTMAVLRRGQERYNINCAPCHARTGDGLFFSP